MIENEIYFLDNYKFIEISKCWLKISSYARENYNIQPLYLDIPTRLINLNRKLFLKSPDDFISMYKDKLEKDFNYDDYNLDFFNSYKYQDLSQLSFDLLFTSCYYSEFSSCHYVTNIKFGTDFNHHVLNFRQGTFPQNTDFMAKLVFDDLEFLQKNINNQFVEKTYLKYLTS